MGTSGSSSGPGGATPLVPSWLSPDLGSAGDEAGNGDSATVGDEAGADEGSSPDAPGSSAAPPLTTASPKRFAGSRSALTRYGRSGGTDARALRRGIRSYATGGTGGSRRAATRMGASRTAGAGLVSFLNDARRVGPAQALARLNLEALADRPSSEILESVADAICQPGGPVDEGIARDAMFETVADLARDGLELETLSEAQVAHAFEIFATRAIEGRILNDVGNKTIRVAGDRKAIAQMQKGMRDLIRGSVRDAIHRAGGVGSLTNESTAKFVDDVYRLAFDFLAADTE